MKSAPRRSFEASGNLRSLAVLVAAVCILLMVAAIPPAPADAAGSLSLGQRLEGRLWADIKAKRFTNVEAKIAPGFQSVHQDGARDRDEELALIRGLDIHNYALYDFSVTRQGAAIIVSYMAAVEETIGGERLTKEPTARISVWLMTTDGWQWISHANLKPLD